MTNDPREILNNAAMTVELNALDGFDVMAISFASSGIAVDRFTPVRA